MEWVRILIAAEAVFVLCLFPSNWLNLYRRIKVTTSPLKTIYKGRLCNVSALVCLWAVVLQGQLELIHEPPSLRLLWIQAAFVFTICARAFMNKYRLEDG